MALWTPQYINTALWLDAADSSTVTLVSNAVSEWRDKSGNARHATQTTAGARPSRADTLNSLSVMTLDGSNDWMQTLNIFTAASDVSVFLVHMAVSENANGRAVFALQNGLNNSNGFFHALQRTDLTNKFRGVFTTDSSVGGFFNLLPPSAPALNTWYISGHARNVTQQCLSWNGAFSEASVSGQCAFDNAKGVVGGYYASGYFWHGSIAEILVVPTYVTASIRQKIEGYLAHKWGLTAGLPANHPYKTTAPTVSTISGTVRDRFGNPCKRKVYAMSRPTDATAPAVLAHGLSDVATGAYELIIPSGEEVTRVVVSEDDADPLLNDLVDRVIPA